MSKILMIIPFQNFREEELFPAKEFFEEKGLEVIITSNKIGKAKGMSKNEINVFSTIDDINIDEYDVIILVGGTGSDIFEKNSTLHKILQQANKKNKIIGATYRAPITLAYSGILEDKKATVWIEDKDILEEYGAYYTGASIEIDDNIITTDGPHSARMFAEEIYKLIKKN